MKQFIYLLFFLFFHYFGYSQPTAGTSGLLNIPSADMQLDGTFMLGANYLPVAMTPAQWDYNTGNYYLNITFLPFLEISYRMTLYKLAGSERFNNQDRSLSTRVRIVKEKTKLPSLVIGSNDIYSSTHGFSINRYFTSFYLVSSKNFTINQHKLGASLDYVHDATKSYNNGGLFGGMYYSPSFMPTLKIIGEYDSKAINAGAKLMLFKHFFIYGMAYDLKHFTGGGYFSFCLNKTKSLK